MLADHTSASYILHFGSASFDIASRAVDERSLGDDFFAVLRAFLVDTYQSCAFHRQRLDRAGVEVDKINSFDAFRSLPVLAPRDVEAVSDVYLLPDRYRDAANTGLATFEVGDRIAKKFLSSGSSGRRPKGSYYTVSDWDANVAMMDRQMGHIPLEKFSRTFISFHPGHFGGKHNEDTLSRYGCIFEARSIQNVNDEQVIKQIYGGLAELGGFNCIAVPPWNLATSQKGATLDGLLNVDIDNFIGRKIKVVATGGAPRDVNDLQLRERVWEANSLAGQEPSIFVEKYGASEVGLTGSDCVYNDGIHIQQGAIYTEVIRPNGEHAKNGETGLVVVTGLRHGSRWLRYVVGDEATYVTDTCRCGTFAPRLRDIKRVMDHERLNAGCAAGGL